MTGHAPHHRHPNFSPAQLAHDGCQECADRAADLPLALNHMDPETFARAWQRAAVSARSGLPDIAEAEVGLLAALAAVQRQLAVRGIPFGAMPEAAPASA